ncbi:unnamed protein product [Protopolystoma xenopodis]|uniref:Uncharacterized protein n=1 Tax=Protopolystoma xenopodis TaxID=117903 RepID=A0A3S5AD57_9PLAT|nr:unnamed protein product [Protopolystoma xenopodis]
MNFYLRVLSVSNKSRNHEFTLDDLISHCADSRDTLDCLDDDDQSSDPSSLRKLRALGTAFALSSGDLPSDGIRKNRRKKHLSHGIFSSDDSGDESDHSDDSTQGLAGDRSDGELEDDDEYESEMLARGIEEREEDDNDDDEDDGEVDLASPLRIKQQRHQDSDSNLPVFSGPKSDSAAIHSILPVPIQAPETLISTKPCKL